MRELLSKLKNNTEKLKLVFKPDFFRISDPSDKKKFLELIEDDIFLTDDIYNQLKELVRSRHPKKTFSEEEYAIEISKHIGKIPLEEYGVWIYYPWSRRLVHLLDEQEFVELRTSRNNYKITDEEEEVLATKKIGVVGLSVGQSVTLTLCMERVIGEIRIADFDTLELTNINRIRSGVHNLAMHKTIIVAREIAEIDPFLKVVPFSEGLNDGNMDQFFKEGGQLDIVIDECDGLDIKIKLREKAKSLQVPVVMEASDRGTLDVERFDLQPDRPLLHGFIDHLDASTIGSLSNEEKIPFILPMLGVETISGRLKASMVEVGQTIVTWPQLASAVALGGAICADVCRRILLNQFSDSGRYFIDIEELVGDRPKKMEGTYKATLIELPEPQLGAMQRDIEQINLSPSAIDATALTEIVTAATLAPSAGNAQPWKWSSSQGNIYLFHNRKKSASWSDEDDFLANIAFGAALENAILKAQTLGYTTIYELHPLGKDSDLVAALSFTTKADAIDKSILQLTQNIPLRLTNRKEGTAAALPASVLQELRQNFPNTPGISLSLLEDRDSIEKISRIVSVAESLRFLHPQAHHEIYEKELKWNDDGKQKIYEGLDIRTMEMELKDEVGVKVASDPRVIALLNVWEKGTAFEKIARKQVMSASAIGLISIPSFNGDEFIEGGRALENFWLQCSAHRIALHPLSAPVFLYTKLKYCKDHGMSDRSVKIINDLYKDLIALYPELETKQGIFLFRLSEAAAATAQSLRWPIDQLYTPL